MENQEANPTKRSYQPSWVIQKDLTLWSKQLSISCQRGILAGDCLSGKRLQKSLILFWPYSSVFPPTWSNLIILHILRLWSLGYLITGCPFRFRYSCQHFHLQTLCLFALKRDILLRKFKDKESFTIYWTHFSVRKRLIPLARVTLWGFLEGASLSNPNFIVSKPAIECLILVDERGCCPLIQKCTCLPLTELMRQGENSQHMAVLVCIFQEEENCICTRITNEKVMRHVWATLLFLVTDYFVFCILGAETFLPYHFRVFFQWDFSSFFSFITHIVRSAMCLSHGCT